MGETQTANSESDNNDEERASKAAHSDDGSSDLLGDLSKLWQFSAKYPKPPQK